MPRPHLQDHSLSHHHDFCENPTQENPDNHPHYNFLEDPVNEMTWGRRLALWLNSHTNWYGPTPTPDNNPSLEKSWAYFEHVTLERYLIPEDELRRSRTLEATYSKREKIKRHVAAGDRKLNIAEPGERHHKTLLYPILSTPLSQLGDFGLGFGIYFATLRDFGVLALLGGLLSLPNILYFASKEYDSVQNNVPTLLKGSAICTDRSWVPCPTCRLDDFEKAAEGAYPIRRFSWNWIVEPAQPDTGGYYLNVTDYLNWTILPEDLPRIENSVVPLNGSLAEDVWIPDYNIIIGEKAGFIYNGTNVTHDLGYTPLWCGYDGLNDCYVDLYWRETLKHDQDWVIPEGVVLVGDTNYVQVRFALKNNCNGATLDQGFINWGTLLIMIVGTIYIYIRTERVETKFDEDEQTAQDYSIVVKNPPKDAWDCDEWKQFFEHALEDDPEFKRNNKVTVCTVDVDNEQIIFLLTKRREILATLRSTLSEDTPLEVEHLEANAGEYENEEIPKLIKELKECEEEIRQYFNSLERPKVTQVFITFETEAAQRHVLQRMSVGTYEALNNHKNKVPDRYLFRGIRVLEVWEAQEPTAIRWQDLDANRKSIFIRKVITSIITFGFIVAAYYAIRELYLQNMPGFASILTTIFTFLFPMVARKLMDFERHHSETERQKWLFLKIAIFNILTTTGLLALITPFQATLDKRENSLPGLIPSVQAIFVSQIWLSPTLQILDIGGNISRHILAPRAKTQMEMNMYMRGTPVILAERYAAMIKFVFMTLWYCSIFPTVFFFGSLALLITYFVDRFSIMRIWSRSAQVGSEVADFARNYFTPLAVCLMSVVSAYYWAGFPYDNLCLDERTELPAYYVGDFEVNVEQETESFFGVYDIFTGQALQEEFTINEETQVYKYCNQDLRSLEGWTFPALPEFQPEGGEWMTPEQEEVVSAHGGSSLIVTVLMIATVLVASLKTLRRFLTASYKPRGEDQNINYSDVAVIDSYVPQVASPLIPYPLFLCDIEQIDPKLFMWQDEDHPYSEYDVTKDVEKILGTDNYPNAFAQIKHWGKKKSTSVAKHGPGGKNGKDVAKESAPPREKASARKAQKYDYTILPGDLSDEVSI